MRYEVWDGRLQPAIGTMKMSLEISSKLNRGTRKYRYLETCAVTLIVKNNSVNPIAVFESSVCYNRQQTFKKKCDLSVLPGKTCQLPPIKFTIGLWADYWSNVYISKISYRETSTEASEMKHLSGQGEYIVVDNAIKKNKKIFVSHSNKSRDRPILEKTTRVLTKLGFKPYIAESDYNEEEPLWTKIRNGIASSHLFVSLYTKDGIESGDVREENGIAVGMDKRKIAIVEKGLQAPGSRMGLEYASVDVQNPDKGLREFADRVLNLMSDSNDQSYT